MNLSDTSKHVYKLSVLVGSGLLITPPARSVPPLPSLWEVGLVFPAAADKSGYRELALLVVVVGFVVPPVPVRLSVLAPSVSAAPSALFMRDAPIAVAGKIMCEIRTTAKNSLENLFSWCLVIDIAVYTRVFIISSAATRQPFPNRPTRFDN